MTQRQIDYSLYLVTDQSLAHGKSLSDIVMAAVQGGAGVIQLREKNSDTRDFIAQALSVKDALKHRNVPLIINDRLDIAMAVGADGIHLGQTDMPLAMARSIAGPAMCIGISVASVQDAIAAEQGGADYAGVSPIFTTPTKCDTAPPLGMAGLREIRRRVRLPLVGIGGLNASNAAQVIENGGDGVAVVSAIMAADDPLHAARHLRTIIDRAKKTTTDRHRKA